jgi:hypothetical protein
MGILPMGHRTPWRSIGTPVEESKSAATSSALLERTAARKTAKPQRSRFRGCMDQSAKSQPTRRSAVSTGEPPVPQKSRHHG